MRVGVAALLLAVAAVVSACGSSPQDLSMGVREAQSAVGTARLALTSSRDRDVTAAFARTMAEEAGTRMSSAASQVSAFAPTDTRTAAHKVEVSRALTAADAAVSHANEALTAYPGAPSTRTALRELDDAAATLAHLARSLGPPR